MGGKDIIGDIPDYKIYKVEGVPRLERLQQRLAEKGLKDPWIRNEVWRFHPNNLIPVSQFAKHMTRPFLASIVVFAVAVTLENYFKPWKYDNEHH